MYRVSGDKGPSLHETKFPMDWTKNLHANASIQSVHLMKRKTAFLSVSLLFYLSLPFSYHLLEHSPQALSYSILTDLQHLKYNSSAMSLTPIYPQGLAFRLEAVVGNRQEDVTEVEELADKRLLAALVASLDMKVCLVYPEFIVSESQLALLLSSYFAAAGPWF